MFLGYIIGKGKFNKRRAIQGCQDWIEREVADTGARKEKM